jgi:lysozyme family protein
MQNDLSEKSRFDIAVKKTLAHEGGTVDAPGDPGGRTRFGISESAYPHLNISSLTRKDAIAIYRRDYWIAPGFHLIENEKIACKLFDLGVNAGTGRAVRLIQKAVNRFRRFEEKLAVDGQLGPRTAEAVNVFRHPKALLMALMIEAGNHYFSIDNPRFLAGWLNRLADIE